MNKIGIYGGTFNPIHIGHYNFAMKFIEQFDLNFLHIIPTFISPFKTNNNVDESNNFHRLMMLKLAFETNNNIIIDEFELNQKKVSYTIDTIRYMKSIYENSELFLMIGEDNAASFNKWKDWEKILNFTELVIILRNNVNYKENKIAIQNLEFFKNTKLHFLNFNLIDISSTQIRNSIKNDASYQDNLMPKVYEYISKNNLYTK